MNKAQHLKKRKLSWATGALLVMMISAVIYGFAEVWCYGTYGVFFPMEYTYLFAAVFVSEVGAMAVLKVQKEKNQAPANNRYLENLGIYGGSSSIAPVVEAETTSDLPNGELENGEVSEP